MQSIASRIIFLLSSGCYTCHTFLGCRGLIALKRTYVCSVNLKALISNKVGSDGIIASAFILCINMQYGMRLLKGIKLQSESMGFAS